MDIQYLKTVLLAAACLNFSKVAEEIPCAQSSVSRQVKYVEDNLGVPLFERPVRGERLKLTEQGTTLLPLIERVVQHYESLEFCAQHLKSQERTPFVVGLQLGRISMMTECRLLEKIYLYAPEHDIQFRFYRSEDIMTHLHKREFDAMLVSQVFWMEDREKALDYSSISGLKTTFLHFQPPCIAMRDDHPFADRKEVDLGELQDDTFILHYDSIHEGVRKDDIAAAGFCRHCERAGFIPKVEIIKNNISELRNTCVENYNWVYPTLQPDWMIPSDRIRTVPFKDAMFGANYYLLNYEDQADGEVKVIRHFFQELFANRLKEAAKRQP